MRDVAYGTKQYNVVTGPEVCFACIQYTCTLSESNSSNNDLNRFRGILINCFVYLYFFRKQILTRTQVVLILKEEKISLRFT